MSTFTSSGRRGRLRRAAHPLLALLTIAVLLQGCAAGVRGEPPFAQVMGWKIEARELALDLRLRNVNDQTLEVEGVDLSVDVGDGVRLFRHSETRGVDIAAGGAEILRIVLQAEEPGVRELERLARGDVTSLAYTLEGTVRTADSGRLAIGREGRIYTVPGRPGEFR